MKIKVRERITNVLKTPRKKTRRWDVEKLSKDILQREKYQKVLDLKLKQKMEGEEGTDKVQEKWEFLEQAVKMTAEEIIGEIKHKKNEEWFDEECAV